MYFNPLHFLINVDFYTLSNNLSARYVSREQIKVHQGFFNDDLDEVFLYYV